tara:strand:- start:563 stop:763 length:201 start_codon:yes stop_codon:yes gene_type:complete
MSRNELSESKEDNRFEKALKEMQILRDEIDRLKTIQQDMAWDITNLSESLTREQRIVDFLTGQQQE